MFISEADRITQLKRRDIRAAWCSLRCVFGTLSWIGNNGGVRQLPVRARDVILNGYGCRVELKHASWRQGAATVVEIHDLCAEVQMASHFKNALRVVKHLVDRQAQLIEVDAWSDAQGINKTSIHVASLSQAALSRAPTRVRQLASVCHLR